MKEPTETLQVKHFVRIKRSFVCPGLCQSSFVSFVKEIVDIFNVVREKNMTGGWKRLIVQYLAHCHSAGVEIADTTWATFTF